MDDQKLCEIVHQATASAMYPRGTHSGETMAVARAVQNAVLEEAATVAEGITEARGANHAAAKAIRSIKSQTSN